MRLFDILPLLNKSNSDTVELVDFNNQFNSVLLKEFIKVMGGVSFTKFITVEEINFNEFGLVIICSGLPEELKNL